VGVDPLVVFGLVIERVLGSVEGAVCLEVHSQRLLALA
jgi:hypothetical protein